MNRKLTFALMFLTVALCALCTWLIVFSGTSTQPPANTDKMQKVVKKARLAAKKSRGALRMRKGERVGNENADAEGKDEKKKPTFALDDYDEASLNEEQRKTIMAIREALGNDDRKKVLRLVQKLQKSDEWPDGIPKSIKMAAIEALGWFGSSCLPELAGFLGDSDTDVVQAAVDKYQEMLADGELSDFERSDILVQAAKVIDDADALDAMMFEVINMRHSVAVDTFKRMMAEGNATAQLVLPDNIEFYTSEESLDTPEKLAEWLEKNPDDEGDDDFYGRRPETGKKTVDNQAASGK